MSSGGVGDKVVGLPFGYGPGARSLCTAINFADMAVLVSGIKRWSGWLSTSWEWIWPILAEFRFNLYTSFFLGERKQAVMDLLLKAYLCQRGAVSPGVLLCWSSLVHRAWESTANIDV